MDSEHPYRPPASDVSGPSSGIVEGNADAITPAIVEALKKTRPWVMFMGIMILLGCALMVLLAVMMMAISSFASEAGPIGGIGLGLIYLVMAALYLYPGVRLLRYAAAIRTVQQSSNRAAAIEAALGHQLAFWRFAGLVTIAIIGLYVVIIVGAIIFSVATGAGG